MVSKIRYKLNFLCTDLAAVSICINAYSNTYVNIVHLKNKPKVNFGLCQSTTPAPLPKLKLPSRKRGSESKSKSKSERENLVNK